MDTNVGNRGTSRQPSTPRMRGRKMPPTRRRHFGELATTAAATERRNAMTWRTCFAVALSLALGALAANAQGWPARTIEMITPFPAGSGVDAIGRAVATALSEQLGQQVVVTNRDGASGTIGFNALA